VVLLQTIDGGIILWEGVFVPRAPRPPRAYFSLRSPYSWAGHRDVGPDTSGSVAGQPRNHRKNPVADHGDHRYLARRPCERSRRWYP
jgi:hypothetical protein